MSKLDNIHNRWVTGNCKTKKPPILRQRKWDSNVSDPRRLKTLPVSNGDHSSSLALLRTESSHVSRVLVCERSAPWQA